MSNKPIILRSQVLNDFLSLVSQFNQLQVNGTIFLPHKVSYAMSKNLNKALSIQKESNAWKRDAIKKYVEMDKKGNPVIEQEKQMNGQPTMGKYKFLSPKHEEDFKDVYESHLNEEVKPDFNRISLSDLEKVDNLPVVTLAMLESMGIISELTLA